MKHTVFVGHYGTGKTTLAVNEAISLKKQTSKPVFLIDCDIVNPYFRSADSEQVLTENGVTLIKPFFAGSNLDVPSLPATVQRVFPSDCLTVWDVGGDDAGAVALGRYSQKIKEQGYEMLAVVNFYRPLTTTADETVEYLLQIENASRLKICGIVNNSNIGDETTPDDVIQTLDKAEQLALKTGFPVKYTTSEVGAANTRAINNYTKKYY